MYMQKISKQIEKLEGYIMKKMKKNSLLKKIKKHMLLFILGLYFYGMFVNSIALGIASTFPKEGNLPVKSIWELNPIKNLAAIFTPVGVGVTFFCVLIICLITKKGYHWFSGYRFKRDPRGFDIIPEGTHGTSGWIDRKALENVMMTGVPKELTGTILGKLQEDGEETAEYVSPKADNGLNEHILVFGATGAGKSRGFVKPFMLQAARRRESIIALDPKGELFESTSEYFRSLGYIVKAYNLLDMENSDGFNCISDIEGDKSLVQSIASVIIKNTGNAGEKDDFWSKAELNLLMALLHYVVDKRDDYGKLLPIEQRSLGTVYEILSQKSFAEIEHIFTSLPKGHPALAPYGIFKLANRQIWGNIAIGLGNRLAVFQNKLVDTITRYNDIDLDLPGQQPCVYYCIISDQDSSLEFLSSMFFSLLFSRLSNYARRNGVNGKLPVKVNMMLDEFCNCGQIVDFKRIISTVRSKGINCQIIIQGAAQLADRYEHNEWEEIIGNCDTQIFLGCNDAMTAEYLSKKCGKVTIRVTNASFPMQPLFSPIYNNTRPASESRQSTGRDLMMPDELLSLDNKKCIILLRGQKPLLLNKIIPDEMLDFPKLKPVRAVDHIPEWRKLEEQKQPKEHQTEQITSDTEQAADNAGVPKTFHNLYEYISDSDKSASPAERREDKTSYELPRKVGLLERYEYVQTTPDEIRKSSRKN